MRIEPPRGACKTNLASGRSANATDRRFARAERGRETSSGRMGGIYSFVARSECCCMIVLNATPRRLQVSSIPFRKWIVKEKAHPPEPQLVPEPPSSPKGDAICLMYDQIQEGSTKGGAATLALAGQGGCGVLCARAVWPFHPQCRGRDELDTTMTPPAVHVCCDSFP
jgi:hypothetical protein